MERIKSDGVNLPKSTALGAIAFLVKCVGFALAKIAKTPNLILFDDAETSCFLNVELVEQKIA